MLRGHHTRLDMPADMPRSTILRIASAPKAHTAEGKGDEDALYGDPPPPGADPLLWGESAPDRGSPMGILSPHGGGLVPLEEGEYPHIGNPL